MRPITMVLSAMSLAAASPAISQSWSSDPWIADLAQARQAFETKYANLDWLTNDREVNLDILFKRASDRLRSAQSDEEARKIIDRFLERLGDGHVAIEWPRPVSRHQNAGAALMASHDACVDLGFDESRNSPGISMALPGYRAVGDPSLFPSGIVPVKDYQIGVIRISGFEPQGKPSICHAAFQALRYPRDKPCDEKCKDSIFTWSYDRLTQAFEEQVRALRASGATVLLIDITDNGGGTEWAEAAARIVSPKPLTSEAKGFVRGPHWVSQWAQLHVQLLAAGASAKGQDRSRLLQWADEAAQNRKKAEQSCVAGQVCDLVVRGGYATGLVGNAHAGEFAGKVWADLVFGIAQFPYHDSVWSGPLAVLVDDQTWSAAEEFAAVLQDNDAAVIVGTRTGGAGCGHTNGGTPTVLENSGAVLELPDCVRFRADGSNEVAGVIPDVLTGIRATDGQATKARLIAKHLPQVVDVANNQLAD